MVAHPDRPPSAVRSVSAEVLRDGDELLLTFTVEGLEHVALPDRAVPSRTDGLWKTTCCELFLAPPGSDVYFEFNYSPSTQWAAYRFDSYRAGGCDLPLSVEPHVDHESAYLAVVRQNLSDLPPGPLQMSLTAVIEETDGTKSYWALAHAPGPPDFHNRATFIATLPVPPHP
ncbi:DOMON-like domain-containing protein [Sphingomonas sp. PAMC 26621]|uniref:DOMON-like domain-containing protein n=1 Tax=Sphingomonas sp. PAMC 26621 TaxID=1112213 RepID=UPI00028A0AFB|nr:DOMON-like domain-containing protein [Sphingomonas sp. PAMC 26621]